MPAELEAKLIARLPDLSGLIKGRPRCLFLVTASKPSTSTGEWRLARNEITLRYRSGEDGRRGMGCDAGPSGQFTHDLGGVLVPPQALEPGMAQFPVRGPFAEPDLGYQPGLDPVHV